MIGRVIWISGLPGSGKTTLARELANKYGKLATVLDGNWVRDNLWPEIGFTAVDRLTNCIRTAKIASMLRNQGSVVIIALVSPLRSMRAAARDILGRMTEVSLTAPEEVLRDRRPSLISILYETVDDITMTFDTSDTPVDLIANYVFGRVGS